MKTRRPFLPRRWRPAGTIRALLRFRQSKFARLDMGYATPYKAALRPAAYPRARMPR
jgi:hypothetical protein